MVSLSRDIGGCWKRTFRFESVGIGDLARDGREEELGVFAFREGDGEGAVN